jgi:hypothetical protein
MLENILHIVIIVCLVGQTFFMVLIYRERTRK